MQWIDRIPLGSLVFGALLLGLAPFAPEPHLWQKLKMLAGGSLSRPIDIFDLFLHGALPVLLGIRLVRAARTRAAE
ncbi:MAG: RND transporter [Thiohalospira sp.]